MIKIGAVYAEKGDIPRLPEQIVFLEGQKTPKIGACIVDCKCHCGKPYLSGLFGSILHFKDGWRRRDS